jgi:hypothetical protein
MTRSSRALIGLCAILALIGLVALVIVAFANRIAPWPIWAQTLFYLAAGLIWLLPLRPLLVWINK